MRRTLLALFASAAAASALAQATLPVQPGQTRPAPAQPAQAAQAQAQSVPVVMYATAWCPYCAKARAYFKRTNTAYVEHDIERSAEARAEFKSLGGRGVPLILVGGEKLRGFNELAFESAYARAERAK
jgi:glutaredoxin